MIVRHLTLFKEVVCIDFLKGSTVSYFLSLPLGDVLHHPTPSLLVSLEEKLFGVVQTGVYDSNNFKLHLENRSFKCKLDQLCPPKDG